MCNTATLLRRADPPVTVTALDNAQLAAASAPVSVAAGDPSLGQLSSGQVPAPESGAPQVVSHQAIASAPPLVQSVQLSRPCVTRAQSTAPTSDNV